MRVLHVVPSLNSESGGPARSVPGLCRALARAGADVTLYAAHSNSGALTIEPAGEPFRWRLFGSLAGRLGAAARIRDAIHRRAYEFDIIHIHSLWNPVATLAAMAAREKSIPYVLSPRGMLSRHSLRISSIKKRVYGALFERSTVEAAAAIHFLNERERAESGSRGFRLPESFVAPNGVPAGLEAMDGERFLARFPELRGRRRLLFLGRLHRIKGLELQIEALSKLARPHPDLVWIAIGPDGGDLKRLQRLAVSKRVDANVKWLGAIDGDLRYAAIAAGDVVLQTSEYECHSMAVNEALAVGAPLVVARAAGADCVEQSGAGFAVPPDADAIARAVEEILNSPGLAAGMRLNGRRFAREELSWDAIGQSVLSRYEELIHVAVPALPEHRAPGASVARVF
ncbi:MAG: hypothetical protein DMF61_03830 [Blastocatellia bacterium AA13]|nr:MAG: hypothetical protein DMF61_03830 [Blastocatellia bacterium AA13]